MEWATRYQAEQDAAPLLEICLDDVTEGGAIAQTAVFVPRHALALEIKEVIESNLAARGKPVAVQILPGRDHRAEHYEAPCQRWREAGELGRKGLPVYSNLCRRSQERQIEKCPHFDDCDYIRAWTAAHSAPFVILVHAYLGVEWDSAGIVYGGSTFDRDHRAEAFAVPHRRFNPTQAAIIVCDEDPTQSLIERRCLKKDALCSITDGDLGELISAGLDAPSGLLSYLHSAAISPERMRDPAESHRSKPRIGDAILPHQQILARHMRGFTAIRQERTLLLKETDDHRIVALELVRAAKVAEMRNVSPAVLAADWQ